MLGQPKYQYGDIVRFNCIGEIRTGTIAIVDRYGTFANPHDVSYDILNKGENMLYKHVPEQDVIEKIGEGEKPFAPY